jgi:hypothetical protein
MLRKEQEVLRKLLMEVQKAQQALDARISQSILSSTSSPEAQQPRPSSTLLPPPSLPKQRSPRKTEPKEHKDDPRKSQFLVSLSVVAFDWEPEYLPSVVYVPISSVCWTSQP